MNCKPIPTEINQACETATRELEQIKKILLTLCQSVVGISEGQFVPDTETLQ